MRSTAVLAEKIAAVQALGCSGVFLLPQAAYITDFPLAVVRIMYAKYPVQINIVLEALHSSYWYDRSFLAFWTVEFIFAFVAIENGQKTSRTQRMQTWKDFWSLQKLFADYTVQRIILLFFNLSRHSWKIATQALLYKLLTSMVCRAHT